MALSKRFSFNFVASVSVLFFQVVLCVDNPQTVSSYGDGIKPVTLNDDLGYSVNRTKRNLNLFGLNNTPTNPNPQNTEGLLASCQLTNLLLYQVLQQRQAQGNPFLSQLALGSGTTANVQQSGLGSLLQPFPAAVNQNLILPTLSTYTTTSTFVTKLTTTAVITIPLLFGNKPVPTTVTRTKTYDVTTSEVKTLTATIQPTVVTPAPATITVTPPSKSATTDEEDEDTPDYYGSNVVDKSTATQEFAENVRVDQQTVATPKFSAIQAKANRRKGSGFNTVSTTKAPARDGNKRRKNRLNTASAQAATTQKPVTRDRTAAYKYGPRDAHDDYSQTPRKQFTLKSNYDSKSRYEPSSYQVEEDPTAVQYPDDYSYYARRLKRGEQFEDEDVKLDRAYLLEPSSDGDYSAGYQNVAEKCPPIPKNQQGVTVTVTHTETRTVTKLVNPSSHNTQTRAFVTPSRARSFQDRGFTAKARTAATTTTTTTTPKSYDSYSDESHQDRRTARYRSRGNARYSANPDTDSQQYYGRI